MLWMNQFVDDELRQLERGAMPKDALFRQEWYAERQGHTGPVREFAGWVGDRLVRAGELLRSWSVTAPSAGAS